MLPSVLYPAVCGGPVLQAAAAVIGAVIGLIAVVLAVVATNAAGAASPRVAAAMTMIC